MTTKSCDCSACASLCRRNPGWPTPAEARAMIATGLAKRMMRDFLLPSTEVGNDDDIIVLAPATEHYGGLEAPGRDISFLEWHSGWCKGRCTFLTADGKCEIHNTGFKPTQCREAFACKDQSGYLDNYEIAKLWDTDDGRAVVREWEAAVGFVS